ncbi:hypothetical protein F5Y00DRAFT_268843 [Daldinia vernicosa]|uniref:uncharacterized protein n=1 Tax=Daldinia vernicosa TaxID=114800 RepID=UPI002007B17A|nr:uncharacterized protein F5Y00DRAFT_268843 [Daldinia vernicosa]KAI0849751.1 hypothetical protein F5Y00DRAFT_268843 [Daldinia vernicosa]
MAERSKTPTPRLSDGSEINNDIDLPSKRPAAATPKHSTSHFEVFIRQISSAEKICSFAAPIIASCILLDQYPPGMHLFKPVEVYQKLYRTACMQAARAVLGQNPSAAWACTLSSCAQTRALARPVLDSTAQPINVQVYRHIAIAYMKRYMATRSIEGILGLVDDEELPSDYYADEDYVDAGQTAKLHIRQALRLLWHIPSSSYAAEDSSATYLASFLTKRGAGRGAAAGGRVYVERVEAAEGGGRREHALGWRVVNRAGRGAVQAIRRWGDAGSCRRECRAARIARAVRAEYKRVLVSHIEEAVDVTISSLLLQFTSFFVQRSLLLLLLLLLLPLHELQYNLSPSNLAEHGLHPWYQHLLINLPLLILCRACRGSLVRITIANGPGDYALTPEEIESATSKEANLDLQAIAG